MKHFIRSSEVSRKIVAFVKKQGLFCLALFLVIALPFLWFLPQRGLIAMYYDNPEWKGEPVFSQLEKEITLKTVKQRKGTFPQENFSVTWSGWIAPCLPCRSSSCPRPLPAALYCRSARRRPTLLLSRLPGQSMPAGRSPAFPA